MVVRDRIANLVDNGTDFFELQIYGGSNALSRLLSSYSLQSIAHEVYSDYIPCGGIVTGIGKINNTICVIIANDPVVKVGDLISVTIIS